MYLLIYNNCVRFECVGWPQLQRAILIVNASILIHVTFGVPGGAKKDHSGDEI